MVVFVPCLYIWLVYMTVKHNPWCVYVLYESGFFFPALLLYMMHFLFIHSLFLARLSHLECGITAASAAAAVSWASYVYHTYQLASLPCEVPSLNKTLLVTCIGCVYTFLLLIC